VVTPSDFLTVGLLVALEGLLSVDNALVLAVLALGVPKHQQRKALRYGIVGAFVFRTVTVLLAVRLIQFDSVKLAGAAYLLYLTFQHFLTSGGAEARRVPRKAKPWLGLSAFWATVVKVELTDVVFAVDSILVGVAMSPKRWVILSGGILGIIMMRLVIGQLLSLVQRHPPLVDGAFIIIGWVAVKLILEFLYDRGYVAFEVPRWLSLGLIVVIFSLAYLYSVQEARRQARVRAHASKLDEAARRLLETEETSR
jgi:YkoY family integral membrane protein